MSRPLDFLNFASDATITGLWAGLLLLLSILAWIGDRRRRKRHDINAVGWVPWRDLSVLTAFGGLVLLAMAASAWVKS
jgi:LPXTG-motif cell wall-anchored protein